MCCLKVWLRMRKGDSLYRGTCYLLYGRYSLIVIQIIESTHALGNFTSILFAYYDTYFPPLIVSWGSMNKTE